MGILNNVMVLEFSKGHSSSFCTMQLADFGAQVIKIQTTKTESQESVYDIYTNRNKEIINVDTKTEAGKKVINQLLEKAHIVVNALKEKEAIGIGVNYEAVKAINSKVVYANLTGYGNNEKMNELDDSDNVVQAISGLMEMTGFQNGEPTMVGTNIADKLAGLNTAVGILMAYYNKINTGEGTKVEVSKFDSIFGILESPIMFNTLLDKEVTRVGNGDTETLVPYDVFPCQDGYFSAGLASDSGWDRFCNAIEMPELIEDTRFCTNELRCENYEVITPIMTNFFLSKTKTELEEVFNSYNIPNAPVMTVEEIIKHPQLEAREMVCEVKDCEESYITVRNPMKLNYDCK